MVLLTLVEYQFWILTSFAAGTAFRAQTGRANTLTVKKMTSQRTQTYARYFQRKTDEINARRAEKNRLRKKACCQRAQSWADLLFCGLLGGVCFEED